jgi:hypothetical protein
MLDFFRNLYQPVNLLDVQTFEANRRGEITADQHKYFSSIVGWKSMILMAFVLIFFLGIFIFMLFPITLGGNWFANLLPILVIGGVSLVLMLLIGYAIAVPLFRYFKFRRDLANHAIRQGQGQLLYGKKGYAFDLGGNTLPMVGNLSNGLIPGNTYQVYYLEESRFLLSATMTHQASPAQANAALNQILASANGFSAEDVLANQQGEVTFAQRSKLFPKAVTGALIVLGSLAFSIPFVLGPLFSNAKTPGAFSIFLILLLAILPVVGGFMLITALLDIFMPKLEVFQGAAFKTHRVVNTGRSSHVEYYYTINQKRFNVRQRAYTALVDGLEYRLYYLPRTKKLVSIEVLNGENRPF